MSQLLNVRTASDLDSEFDLRPLRIQSPGCPHPGRKYKPVDQRTVGRLRAMFTASGAGSGSVQDIVQVTIFHAVAGRQ